MIDRRERDNRPVIGADRWDRGLLEELLARLERADLVHVPRGSLQDLPVRITSKGRRILEGRE